MKIIDRRSCLLFLLSFLGTFLLGGVSLQAKDTFKRVKPFQFRIKKKSKTITNVTIMGWDLDNAKYKLFKKYPGCTIISSKPLRDS